MAVPTCAALHTIKEGEELVDHPVSHAGVVVASAGGQRLELVEEEDARAVTYIAV